MNEMIKHIALIGLLFVMSCSDNQKPTEATKEEGQVTEDVVKVKNALEKNGIKLTPFSPSQAFNDIQLSLDSIGAIDGGMASFKFDVKSESYQLGSPTADVDAKMCANSGKGQHIHFILNNQPYKAFYTNEFEAEVAEGSNVLLAFVSRSYHESIKTKGAYLLKQISGEPMVDSSIVFNQDPETGELSETLRVTPFNEDTITPHLFYSRPKGNYVGKDANKIMLDFYLVNTTLAEDGNRVKVSIDSTDFTLTQWVPYYIEGLSMGEHKLRIQLLDKDNQPVYGLFNDSGERTFTLADAAIADQ